MGDRYHELLQHSDLLLCQLHGYAACQEPAIRAAVRQGYSELVERVQHLSGAPDEEIQRFFAIGHAHQRGRRDGRARARRAVGPGADDRRGLLRGMAMRAPSPTSDPSSE